MFAGLLPGVRDLRTPLAIGYVWLISAWLWLHDRLPDRASAREPMADLYELGGLLPASATLAAVTFMAYFLGSTVELDVTRSTWLDIIKAGRASWEAVALRVHTRLGDIGHMASSVAIADAWERTAPSTAIKRAHLQPVARLVPFDERDARRRETIFNRIIVRRERPWGTTIVESGFGRRYEVAPPPRRGDKQAVAPDEGELAETVAYFEQAGLQWKRYSSTFGAAVRWHGRMLPVRLEVLSKLSPVAIAALYAIQAELPDLATRLLVERPALFDRYDRLMAEASIRINLFLPTLSLVATLALRAHALWWFGAVVCFLLLYQGMVRRFRANSIVLDSIAAKLIDSPTILAMEGLHHQSGDRSH